MPARVSESYVLRTFPYSEADLIVSFFTRDQGKLRGVAKRARRPKSPFGAGLERLTRVHMRYYQKETTELVRLDSCDMLRSPFELRSSFETSVGLDYIAEVTEQLLPAAEPNEKYFRLITAVTEHLAARTGPAVWCASTYFTVWAVRLSGFLPEPRVSAESRELMDEVLTRPVAQVGERAWSKATGADLRRFLVRLIEDHIERRLLTAPVLEAL
ncbi:MAG TPA: DNA repair protein RecO [Solibacterales bacterium]|nr:DNA repair protein RecO [Bryobacterales bacterium]